jgi:hypothetical protein
MPRDNLKIDSIILAEHDKQRWLKRNPGILAEVARQLSRTKRCSKQAVSAVYRGKRRSKRIERALRRLRAPGFEPKRMAA